MSTILSRKLRTISVAAALLLMLSACADPSVSARPTIAKSPTPSHSAAAAPVASVRIEGTRLVLQDADGGALDTVPFVSDLDAAVSKLTSALGSAPEITEVAQGSCNNEFTKYDWHGLALSSKGASPFRTDDAFVVAFDAAQAGAAVGLVTAQGAKVGDPAAPLLALPDATGESASGFIRFSYDLSPMPLQELPDEKTGISVTANLDSIITIIRAPVMTPDYC